MHSDIGGCGRNKLWLFCTACLGVLAWSGLSNTPALAQDNRPPPLQSAPAPPEVLKPSFLVTPTIGLQETYTDNAILTAGGRSADFITRLSLGLKGVVDRGRLTGELNALGFYDLYARHGSLSGWSLSADAVGAYALVRDRLVIEAEGSLTDEYVSLFDQSAIDRSGVRGRTRVGVYTVGPRFTSRVGDFADLTAVARFGQVFYSAADSSKAVRPVPSNDTFIQTVGKLDTGERSRRYQLLTTAEFEADDQDYRSGNLVQSAYLRLSPALRLIGRGGYERVRQSGVVDISSPVLSAGFELQPNANSRLTLEGGRRYKRSTWAATADLRLSPRLALAASYSEILAPDQLHLAAAFADFVADTAKLPRPSSANGGFRYQENLYDQSSYNKRAEAHLRYNGASNVFEASARWSDRRFLVTHDHDRSVSADVTATRHIRPDVDATAAAHYSHTYASPLYGASRTYGADGRLAYRLNSTTDLQAGYSHRHARQLFAGGDKVAENVVLVAIQKRF